MDQNSLPTCCAIESVSSSVALGHPVVVGRQVHGGSLVEVARVKLDDPDRSLISKAVGLSSFGSGSGIRECDHAVSQT